jgi:putative transposase
VLVKDSFEGAIWTPIARRQHSRERLRFGSDLTDAEWAIIAAMLPAPEKTGRPDNGRRAI